VTGPRTHFVRAEPLSAAAFRPFGDVVEAGVVAHLELRGGEVFNLDVLSYDHRPLRVDHLNRHHQATQALIPLNAKPCVLVVAPPAVDFSSPDHLDEVQAFVLDGSVGINLHLGVWHEGPFALGPHVDLANFQGAHVTGDNEVAYLERDLGVVVEVLA
jgi:ureidoglycolate lyase